MKAILVLTSTNPFYEEELKSLCEACHIEVIDVVIQKLEKIKNGDILVLSGSVSKGIENNIYEEICEKGGHNGFAAAVSDGNLLRLLRQSD